MIFRLLLLTKGARASLLLKSLVGISITATYVAQAFLLASGVRYAFTDPNWENFIPIISSVFALVVLRAGLLWTREVLGKSAAAKTKEALRVNLFKYYFRLGPVYMEEGRTGKVQSIFTDGVEALEVFLTEYLPQLLVTIIGLAVILGYMIKLDLAVGSIVLAAVLVCVLCPMFWDRLMNKIGHGHWESYGNLNAQFVDFMQGMTTLKAFNASDSTGRELERDANALFRHTLKKLNVSLVSSAIVGLAGAVGAALSVGVGALHLSMGMLNIGSLSVILFLSTECFRPVTDLNTYWHQSFLGFSAAEKMFEFLDTPTPLTDGAVESAPIPGRDRLPAIEFENVTFAYSADDKPALCNVSIHIREGSKTAIAGKSGAGKSSLVNLLLRFFDPQGGRIVIGGKEIRSVSVDSLRASISVVFQDTYLFYGSIAENIRIAKPDAGPKEIEAASRRANAHDFIAAFPGGYETVVGERGVRLSGGERQRIAIARAMLKDAPILILDEATSNVDAQNERMIMDSLSALMENRTTVVIAHRLSTIEDADEIYVLENGQVSEQGSMSELLKKNGGFSELMQSQNTGAKGG